MGDRRRENHNLSLARERVGAPGRPSPIAKGIGDLNEWGVAGVETPLARIGIILKFRVLPTPAGGASIQATTPLLEPVVTPIGGSGRRWAVGSRGFPPFFRLYGPEC
ncbi:hypothetical protein CRG98_037480 [Punica granatum]|uniref:Uncharacterized protein n=1 Tax=Punica granatum TaxID=22663 RepID=A0A2I0IDR5_PUNGR|nr:hypothetical protein CRG98_037480 [Punica granatum]